MTKRGFLVESAVLNQTPANTYKVAPTTGGMMLGAHAITPIAGGELFAILLTEAQQRLGATNREFAKFLAVSETSLYNYKNGDQIPMMGRLEAICAAIAVDPMRIAALKEGLKPRSLGKQEQQLLLDLIVGECSLADIRIAFKESGFSHSPVSLEYHTRRLRTTLGIGHKSAGLVEDPVEIAIAHIVARSGIASVVNLSKGETRNFARGDTFQEFVELMLHYLVPPNLLVPEYALTVITNPEDGKVIVTRNIIDMIADQRGIEIKLSSYDPSRIYQQVKQQLDALLRLQQRPDQESNRISKVKGIDILVLVEDDRSNTLRELCQNEEKLRVVSVESIFTDFEKCYNHKKLIQASPDEIERLKGQGIKLTSHSEAALQAREGLFLYELYRYLRDSRCPTENLKQVRFSLKVINRYLSDVLASGKYQDWVDFTPKVANAFTVMLRKSHLTAADTRSLLIKDLGIPEELLASPGYTRCHYERNGEILTVNRQFGSRELLRPEMALLKRLWKNAGAQGELELTIEHLAIIGDYLDRLDNQRQNPALSSGVVTPSNAVDTLTLATVQKNMSTLIAEHTPGEEATWARELLRGGAEGAEHFLSFFFNLGATERLRSLQKCYLTSRISREEYREAFPFIGEFLRSQQESGHPKQGFFSRFRVEYLQIAMMSKVRRNLWSIVDSKRLSLSKDDCDTLERASVLTERMLDSVRANDADPQIVERFRATLDRAYQRTEGQRRNQRNDSESLNIANRFYANTQKIAFKYLLATLRSVANRTLAIAQIDPVLAADYLFETIGVIQFDSEQPYHRLKAPRADDPFYRGIVNVFSHLTDPECFSRLRDCDLRFSDSIPQIIDLQLKQPKLAKDFWNYLKSGEINKVEALLHLQPEDFQHLSHIARELHQRSDSSLGEIILGKSLIRQMS